MIDTNIKFYLVTSVLIICLISCKNEQKVDSGEDSSEISQETSVQSSKFDILSRFYASGWIGDGEMGQMYISLNEAFSENPHSQPYCVQIRYTPGSKGWAGIYWQNQPDNWGKEGGEDFSDSTYSNIIFWARGEIGGEVVEFKAGGINTPGFPFYDSFEASIGKIVLSDTWRQYSIPLRNKDLSSVAGGFCWVASKSSNPNGLTFYIDDVYYQ